MFNSALGIIAIAPWGAAGSAGASAITARVPFVVAAHMLGESAWARVQSYRCKKKRCSSHVNMFCDKCNTERLLTDSNHVGRFG